MKKKRINGTHRIKNEDPSLKSKNGTYTKWSLIWFIDFWRLILFEWIWAVILRYFGRFVVFDNIWFRFFWSFFLFIRSQFAYSHLRIVIRKPYTNVQMGLSLFFYHDETIKLTWLLATIMTPLTGKVVLIFNCFIKKIIAVVFWCVWQKKERKKLSVSNETNKPFTLNTEYIFENDTESK